MLHRGLVGLGWRHLLSQATPGDFGSPVRHTYLTIWQRSFESLSRKYRF